MLRLHNGGSSSSGNRALGIANNPPSGRGQQDIEVNAVQKKEGKGKGKV